MIRKRVLQLEKEIEGFLRVPSQFFDTNEKLIVHQKGLDVLAEEYRALTGTFYVAERYRDTKDLY